MRYLSFVLLMFSMGVNAIPIQWTSDGQGCGYVVGNSPYACLVGSFFFDSVAGNYSSIDLTFVFSTSPLDTPSHTPINEFVDGDRFHLRTTDTENVGYLVLSGYDLSKPETQRFRWNVYHPLVIFPNFGGILTPEYEPPAVSIPSALPLFGIGLAALGYSRRRHKPE
jgi:hypothetical protein